MTTSPPRLVAPGGETPRIAAVAPRRGAGGAGAATGEATASHPVASRPSPRGTTRSWSTPVSSGGSGARSLFASCRRPPLAALYVGALAVTSVVQACLSADAAEGILRTVSTDLDGLAHAPLFVLAASAFWVDGWGQLLLAAGAFALLGGLQARIGVRRWLGVFALGHVGATLLVAVAELLAIAAGASGVGASVDVGFSYGWCTLAGLAWSHVGVRRRALLGLVALGLVAGLLWGDPFTALGHLVALAIGVAVDAGARGRGSARPVHPSRRGGVTAGR